VGRLDGLMGDLRAQWAKRGLYFGPDGWDVNAKTGNLSLMGEPRLHFLDLVAAELGPNLVPDSDFLASEDGGAVADVSEVVWRTSGKHPREWPALIHAYYEEHPEVRRGLELERDCARFEDGRSKLILTWAACEGTSAPTLMGGGQVHPSTVHIDGPLSDTIEALLLDGGNFAHGVTKGLLDRWGVSLKEAVAAARDRAPNLNFRREAPAAAGMPKACFWSSSPFSLGLIVSELERLAPDQIGPLGTLLWLWGPGHLYTRPLSPGRLRSDFGTITVTLFGQRPKEELPAAFPKGPLWRSRDGKVRPINADVVRKDDGGYRIDLDDGPFSGALAFVEPEGALQQPGSWAPGVDKVTYTRFAGIAAVTFSAIAGPTYDPSMVRFMASTFGLPSLLPIALRRDVATWPDLLSEALSIFRRDTRLLTRGQRAPRSEILRIPGLATDVQAAVRSRVGISMETNGEAAWIDVDGRLSLVSEQTLVVHGSGSGLFEPLREAASHLPGPGMRSSHDCKPGDHAADEEIVWFEPNDPPAPSDSGV
jgi:hypothetical protein